MAITVTVTETPTYVTVNETNTEVTLNQSDNPITVTTSTDLITAFEIPYEKTDEWTTGSNYALTPEQKYDLYLIYKSFKVYSK